MNKKIQFIIDNLQENLEVEVKNWMNGLAEKTDKAKLAKEIIALANNGGGYIFIGFDDKGNEHKEVLDQDNKIGNFTQDTIAGIVNRYIEPPCQCRIEFYTQTGSQQSHPVIIVPGEHRTPLWACRASPDEKTLQKNTVYVRRPGGCSEPARNQDDWEKLLNRLVQARQSEMLNAIREILTPSTNIVRKNGASLTDWTGESYKHWLDIISNFPKGDPRRLKQGHWIVSFEIEPFDVASLNTLNSTLDTEMPKYSGWPPFAYLHGNLVRPTAHGDIIQAYIGYTQENETPASRTDYCDYWQISKYGQGFLLRPMQEDRSSYCSSIDPRPKGPSFDWIIPIYRLTEILKFIEKLGQEFGTDNSSFHLLIRYHNTYHRQLQSCDFNYFYLDGGVCNMNTIQHQISAKISDIQFNIDELVHSILSPVYEQFDFTKLEKTLVNKITKEALGFR